jgi:non-specific serine/threonine protein kinase
VSPIAQAKALNGAAWLAYAQTDFGNARHLAQQALALSHDAVDTRGRAFALTTLAMVAMDLDDYRQAVMLQEQALALYRELDESWAVGACLNNLGVLAILRGEFSRASALLEESMALARRGDDRREIALALVNLGALKYTQGDLLQAQALWTESLTLYKELGGAVGDEVAFEGIEGLAKIAAAQGQARRAARLLAAAKALRASLGVPRPPHIQAAYESAVATVREALGATFTEVQAEGQMVSLERAIAEALAPASPRVVE